MLGVIAAVAGGVAAVSTGLTCWMGIPMESGQAGGPIPPLVEWRIRWACTRWIVQLRAMPNPRTPVWGPWEDVAAMASKDSARAAAVTMAGARVAALRSGLASLPAGITLVGKKVG